ncbi:helix-turn-helix domain containing protein [Mesorhizobium sp. YIM 152430]|uniref:TetR/AcrR family transcriptional regulator n=1 Tax=Mesorhizobium sp. YIM 152430 TaxID=3031761 RepID=UPI0023DC91F6|nr:TetR/AcrR family transcriptional regulator [Mesorhizobium sp. YIM 152430]MDF1598484.1 helix-turn-helix domain containing protein [Mesorhizobium sp. YIM 152430]
MQQESERRSNHARTEGTRSALIEAARALFVEQGYAETGTPQIVEKAGVTRGALYHHFADKKALFRAVVEVESEAVAGEIAALTPEELPALDALIRGGEAFMAAMSQPGRTRLLLLDGPAVLGRKAMDEIDARHGGRTLREGLAIAMRQGAIRRLPLDAVATLLSAMFDRAALDVAGGASEADKKQAIDAIMAGLATRHS